MFFNRVRQLLLFFTLFSSLSYAYYDEDLQLDSTAYIALSHREPKGVGYDTGYTSIAFFLAPTQEGDNLPFIDGRVHLLNNGKFASNIGTGIRRSLDGAANYIVGGSLFYDYRDIDANALHQISLGFEILSERVDFHLNGYLPFGKTRKVEQECFCQFAQNQILLKRKTTASFASIDALLGGSFYEVGDAVDIYVAAGGYLLFGNGIDSTSAGGRFLIEARVYDGVLLGVEATHDQIFNTRVQGYIALSYPFIPYNMPRGQRRWKRSYDFSGSLDQACYRALVSKNVRRQEIIPVSSKNETDVLCCPENNEPKAVVFVDKNSEISKGTFEEPYSSLEEAFSLSKEGDLIYLIAGEDPYLLYEPLKFKPVQILHGSGMDLDLIGLSIPAITPKRKPHIKADGFPAVFLNEGVQILGCIIEESSPHPVIIAEELTGFSLKYNEIISSSAVPSLLLTNMLGGKQEIISNEFIGESASAISIEYETQKNLLLKISDNEIHEGYVKGLVIKNIENGEVIISGNRIEVIETAVSCLSKEGAHLKIFCLNNEIMTHSQEGSDALFFEMAPSVKNIILQIKENSLMGNSPSHLCVNNQADMILTCQDNKLIAPESYMLIKQYEEHGKILFKNAIRNRATHGVILQNDSLDKEHFQVQRLRGIEGEESYNSWQFLPDQESFKLFIVE